MNLIKILSLIFSINFIFSQYTVEAGMFYYDPPTLEIEIEANLG